MELFYSLPILVQCLIIIIVGVSFIRFISDQCSWVYHEPEKPPQNSLVQYDIQPQRHRYNELKRRFFGVSEKDIAEIEKLQDKKGSVLDIMLNSAAEEMTELKRIQLEMNDIRSRQNDTEPYNLVHARNKQLENLKKELNRKAKEARELAETMYKGKVENAKMFAQKNRELEPEEFTELGDLIKHFNGKDTEKRQYNETMRKAANHNWL
jgi:hypothetical protein